MQNILFIYALLGCDKTSGLHGLGKGSSLKAFRESAYVGEQAYLFSKAYDCSEFTPGRIDSVCLRTSIGGLPIQRKIDNFDSLRYTMF